MIRAVLRDGNIRLLESLPLHWKEGEELSIAPFLSPPKRLQPFASYGRLDG